MLFVSAVPLQRVYSRLAFAALDVISSIIGFPSSSFCGFWTQTVALLVDDVAKLRGNDAETLHDKDIVGLLALGNVRARAFQLL